MPKNQANRQFVIRNITVEDIGEVYKLLVANRPYVGLNSRYTYLLLARDFSDSCMVAEFDKKIVAFSSGYVPPGRPDTFFSWEVVVEEKYRGNGLQKKLLLKQISQKAVKFLEATVNPSNEASKRNYEEIAKMLQTTCKEALLFGEADFEHDGQEAEFLLTIGPFTQSAAKKAFNQSIQ